MAINAYYAITWPRDSSVMSLTPGTYGEIYVPEGPDIALIQFNRFFGRDVYGTLGADMACRVDFAGDGTALLTLTRYSSSSQWASIGVDGTPLVSAAGNPYEDPDLPLSATISDLVAGDELVLSCHNYFDHVVFYTGPPWRNPDGLNHAKWTGWATIGSGAGGNSTF